MDLRFWTSSAAALPLGKKKNAIAATAGISGGVRPAHPSGATRHRRVAVTAAQSSSALMDCRALLPSSLPHTSEIGTITPRIFLQASAGHKPEWEIR